MFARITCRRVPISISTMTNAMERSKTETDKLARRRLREKVLARWENEGGSFVADAEIEDNTRRDRNNQDIDQDKEAIPKP